MLSKSLKKELTILSSIAAGILFLGSKRKTAALFGIGAAYLYFSKEELKSLKGKSIIITGGSRGLGLALARDLVKEKAKVTIIARDQMELDAAEKELQDINSQLEEAELAEVFAIKCDITSEFELGLAFLKVEDKFGRIDVLINNAGSICVGPFESMEIEDFEAQMNLHVYSVIKATKLIIPFFKKYHEGHIVNISSIGGKIPVPHMSTYSASKFALAGFASSVAPELALLGIKMTNVFPGLMRTGSPIQAVFKGDHAKEFSLFSLGDMMPGISVSAEFAAKTILEAVKTGDSQVLVSSPAKIANFAYSNFPEVFNTILKLTAKLMPQGQSLVRKTGAKTRRDMHKTGFDKIFNLASQVIEDKMNQMEKDNAEFNLNIKETQEHDPKTNP